MCALSDQVFQLAVIYRLVNVQEETDLSTLGELIGSIAILVEVLKAESFAGADIHLVVNLGD